MRAGLAFVIASLLVGGAFREWRRTHETRLADLIENLEFRDRADRGRPEPAGPTSGPDTKTERAGTGRDRADLRPAGDAPSPPLRPALLDLNRATAAELERLPGIGPSLAARIIADREQRGPYGSPETLLRVSGIGPRTLARLRPYLAAPRAAADSGSPIAN
jgi:competence ComEA-like helix-hairpin-helix protein